MEEERVKTFNFPKVALVPKRNRPKGSKNNRVRQYKMVSRSSQKDGPKTSIAKKQRKRQWREEYSMGEVL